MNAEIVSYEWAEYLKRTQGQDRDGAFMLGWTGDNGDPDNFLDTLLGCDAVGGTNRARWCNKEFDDLIRRPSASPTRRAHASSMKQAQVIFKQEAPWATIAHSIVFMPMRKKVVGYGWTRSASHLRRRRSHRVIGPCTAVRRARHARAGLPDDRKVAGMVRFLLGRLAVLIPTFIGITIIAFVLYPPASRRSDRCWRASAA